MTEQPRVLLLLPTTTYKAADFLAAAERLGVEAIVGSEQRQALEDIAPGRTLTLGLHDAAKAARQIAWAGSARPFAAVVPTDDLTAVVAAHASELLGLPHNSYEAAHAARRKDRLRGRLTAAGVRTPSHRVIRCAPLLLSDADLASEAAAERYPCVLKPVSLAASRGVIRADNPDQFAAAFRRIEAILKRPDVVEKVEPEARSLILVEEYVDGMEVALEGILSRGRLRTLAIFDKPDPLEGPFFEETIYVTPSRLREAEQRAIEVAVAASARALNLQEGPVHAELRLAPGELPWLIELAARSIGGLCSRVLRFGAGVSLEEVILMHALGTDIDEIERERRAAGVLMLPIPRSGRLAAVRGLEEARALAGVEEVTLTATIGQPVEALPEGSSYLGFVFARAATPAEAEAALRAAQARIEAEIEPVT
ncbi:MAG TPA: ATP-grasp domain-containing protein [Candidatus Polarisedimenticolia bacterium]|nr:ATP-grasp domain-containing protein [Candidatus Polarisedimenticolia bacterium]